MKTFRLTLMLLFISIAAKADNEIFTTNNGVIVPNASFVTPLYYHQERNHDEANYTLVMTQSLSTRDGHVYELKAYQHKEDISEFADSTFSRLVITCKAPERDADGNIKRTDNGKTVYNTHEPVCFVHDNMWTYFNCFGFGLYTGHSWKESGRYVCRKVDLADNCCAVLLRGWPDATALRDLTIILLKDDQITLVYNQARDITGVAESDGTTVYTIQDNWFRDDEETLIPHLRRLVFGNGTITEENSETAE